MFHTCNPCSAEFLVLGETDPGLTRFYPTVKIWSMWRYSRRVDTDPALVVPIGLRTRVVLQVLCTL